jgi:S1-C subfamily serine protease
MSGQVGRGGVCDGGSDRDSNGDVDWSELGVGMRRAIVAVVAGLYAFCGAPYAVRVHARTDWGVLVKELTKSVVTIERDDNGTSCTGFIINSKAKDKDNHDVDYVLTASHCEAGKLWADQSLATVIAKNKDKDLLVLSIEDSDRPALKLAKDNPTVGQEAASFGYGYGLEKPLFRLTHISAETYIPYDGIGGPLFFTDATFVGGQSGGPVINADGEVVMMVQLGTNLVGMGVGAETIRQRVGKYWEKPAAKP